MNVTVVDNAEGLAALRDRVASASIVALDTEFHNERSYAARLMVIQLVVGDEVVIVDPLRVPDVQPLADALIDKTIVGHALASDLKIFSDRFDRLPVVAFDTQLAAAFLGYGMSISLADLVHDLAGVRLRKAQTVSDWSARPLSAGQIEYLVADVAHLLPMREKLATRLYECGRYAWFEEEARSLVDPTRYRTDPERLYLRIPGAARMNRRELGVLRELALLRDKLARERDVPAKYIVPDDAMAAIVHMRPDSLEDLAQLRRIDAGMRKAYGDQLVAAVQRGAALDEAVLPTRPVRPPGHDREAIVACLSVLTSAIAAENGLPPSLLLPRVTLERIARELPATEAAVAQAVDAGGWRSQLIAGPLHDLLRGRTALVVHGSERNSPRIERIAVPE